MGQLLYAAKDAAGTVKGLMLFINNNLNTKYRNTDYYAWRKGTKRTPNTVATLLRPLVIEHNFSNKQAKRILDLIETTEK